MVYFDGFESVGECLYLSETLDNRSGNCDVFVNPDRVSYLVNKVIIINKTGYPEDKISQLLSQNCKVISRVKCDIPGVEVSPYVIRINMSVMWNGQELECWPDGGFAGMMEDGSCNFVLENYVLYFPRIYSGEFTDASGNLTILGWIEHQVGQTIDKNSLFCNLDLIKTKKILP